MTFGLNWELASSELSLVESVFSGLYGCTKPSTKCYFSVYV